MNSKYSHVQPLNKAIQTVGGQSILARALSETSGRVIKQQNIWAWLNVCKSFPPELARTIERITNGVVKRSELCPKIFPPDEEGARHYVPINQY